MVSDFAEVKGGTQESLRRQTVGMVTQNRRECSSRIRPREQINPCMVAESIKKKSLPLARKPSEN